MTSSEFLQARFRKRERARKPAAKLARALPWEDPEYFERLKYGYSCFNKEEHGHFFRDRLTGDFAGTVLNPTTDWKQGQEPACQVVKSEVNDCSDFVAELPVVDSAVVAELPVVDSAVVAELPVVDSAFVAELPVVDSAVVAELPVVDSAFVAELPVVDSAFVGELPVVDSALVAELPVVDSTITSRHSTTELHTSEKQACINNVDISEALEKLVTSVRDFEITDAAVSHLSAQLETVSVAMPGCTQAPLAFNNVLDENVPRLFKLEFDQNKLLRDQLNHRAAEVQQLLCIEEENVAWNELHRKFIGYFLDITNVLERMETSVSQYESFDLQARHALSSQVDDLLSASQDMTSVSGGQPCAKFMVMKVRPTCGVHASNSSGNMTLVGDLSSFSSLQDLDSECVQFGLSSAVSVTQEGRNETGGCTQQNLCACNNLNRYSRVQDTHRTHSSAQKYSLQGNFYTQAREVERSPCIQNILRLQQDLENQNEEFQDLLACLGQESAKVHVLSSKLQELGAFSEDLFEDIDLLLTESVGDLD